MRKRFSDIVLFSGSEIGEVTLREALVSIAMFISLVAIGVLIGNKISEHLLDVSRKYTQAIHIQSDSSQFQYVLDTNLPGAFVYGTYESIGSVSYPDVEGEYLYASYTKEKYTQHTRQVSHTDGKGHTYCTTETYWTWDNVGSDFKHVDEVKFCGIQFKYDEIDIPDSQYIDTVYQSTTTRYKYYGVPTSIDGTLFVSIENKQIAESEFFDQMSIEQAVETATSRGEGLVILFWVFWILLSIGAAIFFVSLENRWLTR